MSNPDPNLRPDLRRERERHAGPLIGIALVVIFAVALIFWWMMDEAADAPGPASSIEQSDGMEPPASAGEGAVDLPAPEAGTVTPAPDLAPGNAAGTGTGEGEGTGEGTGADTPPAPTTPPAPAD